MRKIMSCLDLGTYEMKLIVAECVRGKVNILGIATEPTTFMRKDTIADKDACVKSLEELFHKMEEKLGFQVKSTLVLVPSKDAEFTIGNAKVDNESSEGFISSHEYVKALKHSAKDIVPDNMELVTISPIHFTLEDGTVLKNPIGKKSNTLETKTVIITALKENVYSILECLENLKIDVVDIGFDSIGDYYSLKEPMMDDKVGAVINVGHTKTTVSIINKGVLTNTAVIYLGGKNIENDISYVYKTSVENAHELKEHFALCSVENATETETVALYNENDIKIKVNQKEVSQIVESRLEEILHMAKKQINLLTKKEIGYIMCTGGVSMAKDFKVVLQHVFGTHATLGAIETIGVRNNKYSSALGLIKWYDENQKIKNKDYSILSINEQEELGIEEKEFTSTGVIEKVFNYFFEE